MVLISSNMHNCNQTTSNHILLLSNNLDTLKCGQLQSTTSNHSIKSSSTQITFNTLKDAQMHSTVSNHHPNASNIYSSITKIQINTYNLQLCTCTHPMLHRDTPTQNVPHFQMHCKRKSGIVDHRPFSIASLWFTVQKATIIFIVGASIASSIIHICIWENPWGGCNLVYSPRDGNNSTFWIQNFGHSHDEKPFDS